MSSSYSSSLASTSSLSSTSVPYEEEEDSNEMECDRPLTASVSGPANLDVDAVRVYVRVRPQNRMEAKKKGNPCVTYTNGSRGISLFEKNKMYDFNYTKVFQPDSSQFEVFEEVALPVVEDIVNGVNGAILCYGQTSSGKTYTMEGDLDDPSLQGISPRVLRELFERINETPDEIHYEVFASCIEIYKEKIYDLLAAKKRVLKPRHDPSRGLWLPAAEQVRVPTFSKAFETLQRGAMNREIAETNMNLESSRSHVIFLLTILSQDKVMGLTKISQLYLVDLAGSEKVCKTLAEGERLEEAKKINVSLLALENVISALNTKKRKESFVPYRDSKLTFILQNAFGGNSRTAVICTVSESSWNVQESLSTLRFGERARNIRNAPKVNQERSASQLQEMLSRAEKIIEFQRSRIDRLEKQVKHYQEIASTFLPGKMDEDTLTLVPDSAYHRRPQTSSAGSSFSGGLSGESSHNRDSSLFNSQQMLDLQARIEDLEWENSKFRENLVQVPPHFVCPISKTLMSDPVITSDGHTYQRDVITQWLVNKNTSPMTGARLASKDLVPNHALRSLIMANPVLRLYLEEQQEEIQKMISLGKNEEQIQDRMRQEAKKLIVRSDGLFLFASAEGNESLLQKLAQN